MEDMQHIEMEHESMLQRAQEDTLLRIQTDMHEMLQRQLAAQQELSYLRKAMTHLEEWFSGDAAQRLARVPASSVRSMNLRKASMEGGESVAPATTVRAEDTQVTWNMAPLRSEVSGRGPRLSHGSVMTSTTSTGQIAIAANAIDAISRRSMSMNSLHVRSVAITSHSTLPLSWPASVKARSAMAKVSDHSAAMRVLAEATKQRMMASPTPTSSRLSLFETSSNMARRRKWLELLLSHSIVHPTSRVRMTFDVVSLVILLFDLLVTPFAMAFDLQETDFFTWGSIVTLVFWTMSFFANFRMAFYRHGEVETGTKLIARHYATTWLVPDILLVLIDWFSMVVLIVNSTTTTRDTETSNYSAAFTLLRFSKVGRLLRLFGIFRMARFAGALVRLADRCMSNTVKNMIETLGFIFALLWVNHLLSCAWVAIGRKRSTDTGYHWLDWARLPGESESGTFGESSYTYQYATALHWSLTQMSPGSMQVHALNTNERFFTIFCVILGILCSGSIVSTLTAKMMQVMMKNKQHAERLNGLRNFLRQKSISRSLAMNVQKMVVDRMSAKRPLTAEDIPALQLLSLALRAKLQDEL
mmetsp:Transcript_56688/g.133024  ORF Transcript_56688/g.133024 Transcript_56688/m.133024 type:complete len:586 (-) Transcript_56688:1537-3294(-)